MAENKNYVWLQIRYGLQSQWQRHKADGLNLHPPPGNRPSKWSSFWSKLNYEFGSKSLHLARTIQHYIEKVTIESIVLPELSTDAFLRDLCAQEVTRLPCEQILGANQPLGGMALAPSSVNAFGVNVLETQGIHKCHLVTKGKKCSRTREYSLCNLRA